MNGESVLGKFKDEIKGLKIYEMCALASKMYGFERDAFPDEKCESVTSNKCKGSVRSVVKKFKLDRYKDVLKTGLNADPSLQYRITSKNHELLTIEEYKANCRLFDDKKYILDDIVDLGDGAMGKVLTRSLGHWRNKE